MEFKNEAEMRQYLSDERAATIEKWNQTEWKWVGSKYVLQWNGSTLVATPEFGDWYTVKLLSKNGGVYRSIRIMEGDTLATIKERARPVILGADQP